MLYQEWIKDQQPYHRARCRTYGLLNRGFQIAAITLFVVEAGTAGFHRGRRTLDGRGSISRRTC